MLSILRDLLRHDRGFAAGVLLLALVLVYAGLSFVSPYSPLDSFVVPPDMPPGWPHVLGTTSRGQDVFWLLSFAICNTLAFGCLVAVISRVLSLVIGLVAGYAGGWVDRALMSVNDTFIVIPLFPILVLFYFVMRDKMSWVSLAAVMACLGWAYDARLIRSVALSLRTREFTETSIFSGECDQSIRWTDDHVRRWFTASSWWQRGAPRGPNTANQGVKHYDQGTDKHKARHTVGSKALNYLGKI